MSQKVWYYSYYGVPVCREKGLPIHSTELGNLITPENLCKEMKGLKIEELNLKSDEKDRFYKTEWPK